MGARTFYLCLASATLGACVDPLTAEPVNAPEWHAKNVAGYAKTVAGLPPDSAYAWDLRVVAGTAHWRECTTTETCGQIQRERPASELFSFKRVGRATAGDAGEVDVLELSLAPRPTYIVPLTKPR